MTCACPQERIAQHETSPGCVTDDEDILFVLISSLNTQDGDVSGSSFSNTDLNRGTLSVCRVKYSSVTTVQTCVVDPLTVRPGRSCGGAVVALAGEIRAIATDTGERVYCVVDHPIHSEYVDPNRPDMKFPEYLGHAHIGYSGLTREPNFWQRNQRAAMRANLALIFKRRGPPAPIEYWFI